MTRISYAQNGEDVRVWRAFRDLQAGFYVEVGASHPVDDSLTAALSAEGWSGLLVEPEPAAAEVLRKERPRDTVVAAAASAAPGVLSWSDDDGVRGHGAVSGAAGGITVPAVRVADLLDHLAPEAVHFLSVDVEGHEKEALEGVDLARWQPWVLCVEATAPASRRQTHAAWEPLVLGAGYTFVAFDGLNRWYVAPGHEDLAEQVAEPFGVLDRMLDGWEPAETVELRRLEAAARAAHQQAQAEAAAALHEERQRSEHALAGLRGELAALRDELASVVVDRDAVLERERILLTSKSWRVTKPLRSARLAAWLALRDLRGPEPSPGLPPVEPETPADRVRRRALTARVEALRSRGAR